MWVSMRLSSLTFQHTRTCTTNIPRWIHLTSELCRWCSLSSPWRSDLRPRNGPATSKLASCLVFACTGPVGVTRPSACLLTPSTPEHTNRNRGAIRIHRACRVSALGTLSAICSSLSSPQSAMYLVLIHDRRLTECWSQLGASLRTAQAIGLHRDGSKLGLE